MIWKNIQTFLFILLAYLIQTTILPYLRVYGVIPDLILLAVCLYGVRLGPWMGLITGLYASLLMEVLAGDIPVLTSVVYTLCGLYGAYIPRGVVKRLDDHMPSRSRRRIERMLPALLAAVYTAGRETVYIAYFYLSGVEIFSLHILRAIVATLLNGVVAFLIYPALTRSLNRTFAQTLLGRRITGIRKKIPEESNETAHDKQQGMGGMIPAGAERVRRPTANDEANGNVKQAAGAKATHPRDDNDEVNPPITTPEDRDAIFRRPINASHTDEKHADATSIKQSQEASVQNRATSTTPPVRTLTGQSVKRVSRHALQSDQPTAGNRTPVRERSVPVSPEEGAYDPPIRQTQAEYIPRRSAPEKDDTPTGKMGRHGRTHKDE